MKPSLVLVFLVVFLSALPETESCHVGWIQFQDKCYLFSHTTATWFDAGSTCSQFHSKLAEPRTDAEISFLRSHGQSQNKNMWIGVSDIIEEGRWEYSSTQEVVPHHDFQTGEPNGHLIQNCVALWKDHHGKWADHVCAQNEYYICEEIITSNPDNVIG